MLSLSMCWVPVNLSKINSGVFEVCNKAGRLERIQRLIQESKRTFPPKKHDMQVIAGLLQYATGQAHELARRWRQARRRLLPGTLNAFVTGCVA